MSDDPAHETAWLRGLVVQVAEGLERLAAAHEADRLKLERAAMWLRRQLHRGPPPAGPASGIGVGQGPGTAETARSSSHRYRDEFRDEVRGVVGGEVPPRSPQGDRSADE